MEPWAAQQRDAAPGAGGRPRPSAAGAQQPAAPAQPPSLQSAGPAPAPAARQLGAGLQLQLQAPAPEPPLDPALVFVGSPSAAALLAGADALTRRHSAQHQVRATLTPLPAPPANAVPGSRTGQQSLEQARADHLVLLAARCELP